MCLDYKVYIKILKCVAPITFYSFYNIMKPQQLTRIHEISPKYQLLVKKLILQSLLNSYR